MADDEQRQAAAVESAPRELSDEDIKCWLNEELAPSLADALRELQRRRADDKRDDARRRACKQAVDGALMLTVQLVLDGNRHRIPSPPDQTGQGTALDPGDRIRLCSMRAAQVASIAFAEAMLSMGVASGAECAKAKLEIAANIALIDRLLGAG